MKKIFLLFLISVSSYGQAVFEEGIQVTGGQPTVITVNYLPTVEVDGLFAKINPVLLPLSTATINAINTASSAKVNISSGVNTLNSSTKRYYALGDSITHGFGTTSGNTGYSDLINTQYPFLAYQKFAQLGATAMPTTGRPPLSDQVGFIPANATLITVMIGVNDFLVGNVIGNPDAVIAKTFASLNQATNFCEAFRYNLETIKINFPNAKVRVITPLRVANSRTGTYRFQDYIDAEILISNFLGIPVIDAYNNSEIYYNSSFIPDGLHPNDAGQLMLKEIVLNGLIAPKQANATNDANVIHKTGDETKTGILTLSPTITATANNQTLVGAYVDPNYITGAFTGLNLMAFNLNGGIIPKTTSVYSLGSPTNYWSNIFSINAAINNISANQVTLNTIKSGSASGINFLNSAGTVIKAKMFDDGHFAIQNGSTYNNEGYLLALLGVNSFITTDIAFRATPTTSAGTYDILSVNTSTFKVEKIASTTFAPNILTGYVSGAGTVSATDTPLQAIQKLNGNIASVSANLTTSGTYTPVCTSPFNFGGGVVNRDAVWTRTGNIVNVKFDFVAGVTTAGIESNISISLPFTVATGDQQYIGSGSGSVSPFTNCYVNANSGATVCTLFATPSITTSARYVANVTYIAAP